MFLIIVDYKKPLEEVERYLEQPAGTFDAILTDLMMPVMDGCEAARAIRGSGRADAESIPIIALTANAFLEDMQKSKDAGMDAHLSKPVDIAALEQTVKRFRVTPPQLNSGIARFRR